MPLAFWFWFFLVLFFLVGGWVEYVPGQPWIYRGSRHLLVFVLLALLGWKAFGAPWDALVK
jgi:hypothetical protein